MANFTGSGYLAAASDWLTTELNSLASSNSNTLSSAGSAIDNSTDKRILADIEFLAGGTYTPTAGGFIELWLLRTLDGTNYEDGSSTVAPARRPDLIIPVRAGTTITPRAGGAGRLIIPPGLFKPIARNQSGATLPSSGSKITGRYHSLAI